MTLALLSERMRPSASHPERLVGAAGKLWARDFAPWHQQKPFHAVLWGPPGCGKTTLARLLGETTGLPFTALSAVRDGVKEIRQAATSAPGQILFIDEIHRLSKAQQDVLLPILEYAECWVVGATTESPQVSLTPAILSRIRTLYVAPPSASDVATALLEGLRVLSHERQLQGQAPFLAERYERLETLARTLVPKAAGGDVRFALNLLETLAACEGNTAEDMAAHEKDIFENLHKAYTEKNHADFASAMIKSMRGSDPDAALYYAIAALDSGEDPLFLLRRCVIFASEDVGNADLNALQMAVNAYRAVECVGMPEGRIALAQVVTYLASTVKSNRAYRAIDVVRAWKQQAEVSATEPASLLPPRELRLAGKSDYQYPHDFPGAFVAFEYLPPAVAAVRAKEGPAYLPTDVGVEKRLRERLSELWHAVKAKKR